MESVAPISDLITGTVLYNKMVEDIVSGETDLTITEHRILFFLANIEGGQARIRTLAEALVLRSSTVSDAVKELEEASLVQKIDRENDLKAVWTALTEEGEAALAEADAIIERETAEYWAIIGPEVSAHYFASATRLLKTCDWPLGAALERAAPVFYSFTSRRYLLSYVSWFKSTYNLSLIDVRILFLLLERDKELTCTEVAHLLKVSNSAVSNAVRRLSRIRKYVERTRAASGHEVQIGLTAEGADRASEVRERFIRFHLEQFNQTREEFEESLHTVHPRRRKSYMQKVFGEGFAD